MKRKWMILVFFGAFMVPGLAGAVEEEDFVVDTTGDLIELCSAPQSDPLHTEAVNFCVGFLVGAYHYQVAQHAGPKGKWLVCPPDPPPSTTLAAGLSLSASGASSFAAAVG
ncbi:hypothetical protein LCGC14_3065480 [marine sediment metagenome]|uniref:Rap1a immunity protein domain-containing protein n=1 Tax=marine sediment metagenome TaxID=412755 RepID=A0A0F8WI81_9ZZZZ